MSRDEARAVIEMATDLWSSETPWDINWAAYKPLIRAALNTPGHELRPNRQHVIEAILSKA